MSAGAWQAELRQQQQALQRTLEPAAKATILVRMGLIVHPHQPEQAGFYYRQALKYGPHAEAELYLGQLAARTGERFVAETHYRRALALRPQQADIWIHLGLLQLERGEFEMAETSLKHALHLSPAQPQALLNLAQLQAARGQWDAARSLLETLLSQRPDSQLAWGNLGQLWLDQGLPGQAIAPLERSLALGPRARDLSRLGVAYHMQGLPEQALACFEQACAHDPADLTARANLLNCRLNLMPWDAAELLAAFGDWGDRLLTGLQPVMPSPVPATGPRLRVGYLSADFRAHSAARVYEWLFRHHDRQRFEIFAYANQRQEDDVSHRLAGLVDGWRRVGGFSDRELEECLRADQLHVLVDLSGHTAGGRLAVLARKPAPVQVTGLGHVFTTGLRAIDYRLSDAVCSPPAVRNLSPERICLLPSWLCWMPPQEEPAWQPPPVAGPLFGSCNHPFKMNQAVFACWSEILRRVPTASLVLKAGPFADPLVRARYRAIFAAEGIAAERICLLPASSYQSYLGLYRHIDLCLDPFPYGGGLTTCDALWMNTPVLALDDGSRGSASLLRQIGADDWIAPTPAAYVERAVELVARPRRNWRRDLLAAPVCQGPAFARALEATYTRIWNEFAGVAA